MDIEVAGLAEHLHLEEPLGDLLPEGATLRAAGKSIAVSVVVPVVEPSLLFAPQQAQCLVALGALQALQTWWSANVEAVAQRVHGTVDAAVSEE